MTFCSAGRPDNGVSGSVRWLAVLQQEHVVWIDFSIVRYLRIYLVSAKMFRCVTDNFKKSFYRSYNSILGKISRTAFELVTVELLKVKCLYQYSCMAWKFAHLLKPR